MSGQFPNRVSNSFAAQPQPKQQQQTNGSSSVSSQMPNPGAHRSMDPEMVRVRKFMAHKIYEFFMQRHKRARELPRAKMLDIVKALEDRLFKSASTKEEYLNQATLESRLHALVRRPPSNNQRQQFSHVNSSISSGTMIPTPGMPQNENSDLLKRSSVDDAMVMSNGCNHNASSAISHGNFPPTTNGPAGGAYNNSLSPSDGPFSNGYQRFSSSFSSGAGGNVMVASRSQQSTATQMMPTPGYKELSIDNINKDSALGPSQPSPDVGIQVKSEPGMESHGESPRLQAPEKIQFADSHNSSSQNFLEEHARCNQLLSVPSDPETSCSSKTRTSEHIEQFMHQHHAVGSQSNLSRLTSGVPSQDPVNLPCEPNVQDEFHQRITSKDEAQKNSVLLNVSTNCQSVTTQSEQPSSVSGAASRSTDLERIKNSRKWLLGLLHARRCTTLEGKCPDPNCSPVQKLLKHIGQCCIIECTYRSCRTIKGLINHHKHCRDASCPVCVPVKNFVAAHLKENSRPNFRSPSPSSVIGSCKPHAAGEVPGVPTLVRSPEVADNSENLEPSRKRIKIMQSFPAIVPESETTKGPVPTASKTHIHQETQLAELNSSLPLKSNGTVVKMECPVDALEESPKNVEVKKENIGDLNTGKPDNGSCMLNNPVFIKQENIKVEKEVSEAKQESVSLPSENAGGSKYGKPKIKGVSLTELFTPEQVREHIKGLRQWIGQSKAKVEKNQAMGRSMSENSCQLCAVERLAFEPPPIYCSPCGARIKRNVMYYTIGAGDTRHYFCISCYNESRGETFLVNGTAIPRGRLEKKKNDEETDEWWVQCDKCEAWQHQICALFNGRRNDGGQAEYTCPNCYVEEVERGERNPLPESSVLGAKDLPTTNLSDHIEQRLARKLKKERQERARLQGKSYNEIPGAEGLVVRIVSSVDKRFEVKPRFLDMINKEDYPSEFPYKSKVLLLFQKIEGVEVCLFGMYVQEYGSECQQPNHRRVYLSYLDSVKYFRPDVKTITGEALRTFVYHEILIGYLEYCKMRGFTSCYIWACPPLKGEDYILYCHPEIQKSPKSDKLREWYLAMLGKAEKEQVVVDITNLYDHFMFDGKYTGWVTAARLPYFDGDYWPGAAEDMIYQLQQEEGRKQNQKGTSKKGVMKRSFKVSGQTDLSGKGTKDQLLMRKLGETICPMKEDFIMVHLQHTCTHCCIFMLSGKRWVCNQCKSFQLCDKCYRLEQRRAIWQRHPIDEMEKHVLEPVEINDVPADTKDKDVNIESEFFDTRQAFLSLCQGNHYQYDTLRRAKHSSMMLLYHLHNPTAPAFVTTCNVCHLDIETGQGWRCETCADYDVCSACYHGDGGIGHPHKFTKHPSMADCDALNKKRKMNELVVHTVHCRTPHCQYENCFKLKMLYRHGHSCKIHHAGGCLHCKRLMFILRFHAQECKESECRVPRCRDYKEILKRQQQQSETRQRVAIMERMRQRAAEVTHNS